MTDRLSTTLAALADPTRRAILARLALGDGSVSTLAEPFAISQPAVSKHLKVLERAGLITRGRDAQWRPCRLEAAPLREIDDWLAHYRQFWSASLDRLEAYLGTMAQDMPAAPRMARRKGTRGAATSSPRAARSRTRPPTKS